jgi:hypothetical protein
LIAAIGLVPQFRSRTLPDIAFLLHAAGRVLDGARLYVDVLEINPPLIVWLNLPIVAAARSLGFAELTVYRVAVVLLLCASVAACRWMLKDEEAHHRRILLLLIVFAFFVLPRLDWGEREHLTLALALPYTLLAAARVTGTPPSRPAALAAGAAAAIGIAIKPQFVLLWLAREGVVMVVQRRARPTVEGWLIVACGAAYLGAVALFTPEYLALVRELGGPYHQFIRNPLLVTALLGDGAAIALGALVLTVGLWRSGNGRAGLRLVLTAALVACYLSAVLQLKGWRYHFYPALSLAWMLLVVLALRARRPLSRWSDRLFVSVAGAAGLSIAAAAVAGCVRQAAAPLDPRYDADPSIGQLIPFARQSAAGRDLIVLSPNMASGFPLTMYAGARWPQRFSNLWPLVAAYDSAIESSAPFSYRDSAAMTGLERRVLSTVAEDLAGADAPLMLVLRTGPDEPRWGMRRLDLLAFLARDDRVAGLLDRYRRLGVAGQYDVYWRRDEPTARPALPPQVRGTEVAPDAVRVAPGALGMALCFAIALFLLFRREPLPAPDAADPLPPGNRSHA